MERINEITLSDLLPRVFVNEVIPGSDVWNTHLTFTRGRRYMIEAASGGGKSSLCAFIFGNRRDYEGKIEFNRRPVTQYSISDWQEIRRRHIAYLPQELSLFSELSAWQNLQLKNSLTSYISDDKMEEWLRRLGIDHRRDYPVGKMSIGQQQRVAILRSVCQPFDFLLLDEPVSHLDSENNRIAAEIMMEEAERQNAAIIATSVGNAIKIDYTDNLSL